MKSRRRYDSNARDCIADHPTRDSAGDPSGDGMDDPNGHSADGPNGDPSVYPTGDPNDDDAFPNDSVGGPSDHGSVEHSGLEYRHVWHRPAVQ
ncbi:hypothetical protein [Phyllobacterium sp. YR620]|uniref:hypothetical protein n=1 Tax=Phyllobacterium sp. YR620 TaxID=1881066 RepID=UPI0011145738|nr:hypothetical protein [Phyllobacterium sp. YR620]